MTVIFSFFFFTHTATTEIYTLSLHDALPISLKVVGKKLGQANICMVGAGAANIAIARIDRKSTRLNSSHTVISYAVFCLKKKKTNKHWTIRNHNDLVRTMMVQNMQPRYQLPC